MSIIKIFFESGLPAQIIMTVLVVFSIWSWGIFFKKLYDFSLVKKKSQAFLASFRYQKTIKEYENFGHLLSDNPHGRILHAGLEEFKTLKPGDENLNPRTMELAENIQLAMDRVKMTDLENLESALSHLATIMTASPFLGLLGTVWGILDAFVAVRTRGSAHITVVAPGISDALITTVYGLLVAIPALIFHNYFRSRINKIEMQLDKFTSEVYAKLRRGLIETQPKS